MESVAKYISPSRKIRILNALLFGFIFSGVLFVVRQYIENYEQSVYSIIIMGLAFGLINELFIPVLSMNRSKRTFAEGIKEILKDNEHVEIQGFASLKRDFERVGGKLFLTNNRLIFNSHKLNTNPGHTTLEYYEIKDIKDQST